MPMPEKILDEKAAPIKPCEDLISNQTAPASGMSEKVDEMISETNRLSIHDEAQVVENTPAQLKESKGKLAQPVPDFEIVTVAEIKPVEFPDTKKRTHDEISNNDLEMLQQTNLNEEAEGSSSKRLKVDDVVPVSDVNVPV